MTSSASSQTGVLSLVVDRITSFFYAIALLMVGVMACLLLYDVVMRYIFNSPVDWVLDIVQLVQVTLAFTAAAPVLRAGKHINMELLSTMAGKRTRRRLELLSNGICAAGSLWMALLGWRTFSQSYRISESSYGITLPLYPWKLLVFVCFSVLFLQFSALFLKHLRNGD